MGLGPFVKSWERVVSLFAVAVIFSGLAYAYERQSLSRTDLNPVFQDINQEYFGGELFGVRVEWRTLDAERGEARKYGEHDFVIFVDRRENTSIADVRRTLEHEACHVAVTWREPEEHGPIFSACVKRY